MSRNWQHYRHVLRSVIFAALFGCVAIFYEHPAFSDLNNRLLNCIYNFSHGRYLNFFYKMTQIGSTPSYIILTILLLIGLSLNKHILGLIFVPVNLIGSVLVNELLKVIFAKPRPQIEHLTHADFFSYPSGHSMSALVFYGFLAVLSHEFFKKNITRFMVWLVASIVVLLIGLSRIYMGVHFPLDVLGGYLAGISWLSLILFIYFKTKHRLLSKSRK